MNTEDNSPKRCVIYTRKSTEEGLDKDFNSLEAQFDACSAYIQSQAGKGWYLLDRHYDDGGFSGGNMNRPALQQLLEDVANGNIDVVVVYKLDRISRSLSDFTELSRLFGRYNVSLVSVTQQIDTSSSMGRMIINLLMSFAQFEREMTSDRVRDKMRAARKKGMWTGGVTPYGYEAVDRKLVIVPELAERVRYAFEQYDLCHSFLETTRRLNKQFGAWRGDKPWNIEHVRKILHSPVFAGKIKDPTTGELFDGQHEAIIPIDLWAKVERYIKDNAYGKQERKANAYIAPLKGVIRCGYCDCAMVPTFCTKNGKHTFHYYRCAKTHKHITENCQLKNISAAAIEAPVFELIEKLITNEYFLQLVASDPEQLNTIRALGRNKAKLIEAMTSVERQRLVHLFIREINVKRDGIDIRVRGDGFKNLMGKGRAASATATGSILAQIKENGI